MRELRYNDFSFSADMRVARCDDGRQVEFTRQERAVLLTLSRRPQRLVPKKDLHEAMSAPHAETTERRVDFVVNRLRHKLGDDARAPRFIATQYGEGYVWVAREEQSPTGLLVIGPIHRNDLANGAMEALVQQLRGRIGPRHEVALSPGARPEPGAAGFALEAAFHGQGAELHGAFVLRSGDTGRVIAAHRTVGELSGSNLADLCEWVRDEIWKQLAMPHPAGLAAPMEEPAEVRLFDAAQVLTAPSEFWRESEARLRAARAERPDDPVLAVLWALKLHGQLISWPPTEAARTPSSYQTTLMEIERLVFDNLAAIDDNPPLKLAAAKLLAFADSGHVELADRLAEEAFSRSTAFAAAHATRAQVLMRGGDLERAIRFYDDAIAMSEFGSTFYVFLMVLKCLALLAGDDRKGLAETATEMALARPDTLWVQLFHVAPEPGGIPEPVREHFSALGPQEMAMMMAYLYRAYARSFARPEHRINIMRGLVWHAKRMHGADVIPSDVGGLFVPAGSE
jgi:DNA-binding winged helix-turn-helix (wHTH) protein/tetratricopeptide (TPR) repeat protein